MKLRVLLAAAALVLTARTASAALTQSEKAQVKDLVARGQIENVGRVRALVARTDLTAEESTGALVEAFSNVAFDEKREAFARELVFGGASAASRPLLATAITKALLARADAVVQRFGGGLDHEARAAAELIAIYMFLDDRIANAPRPASGIPTAAYEDCSKTMRDHLESNARWLKGDGQVGEGAARVRAQAQVLLFDMLPDVTTRRVDAADRLGLKGARRQMLTDWGILFEDAGKLDDAAASRVRQVLLELPGARTDLEVVFAGDDRGPIHARGLVAHAGGGGDTYPFGEEVAPGPYDAQTSGIAAALSVLAARHALDNRGDLKLQADRDASDANKTGRFLGKVRAPSTYDAVGAAIHALIIDAPRALDLAMVRAISGHSESLSLLCDAIGAMAAFAPAGSSLALEVGKPGGTTPISQIRLAPNGAATAMTMEGHTWTLLAGAPRRDGQPVTLAHLATARTPLRDGGPWSESGWTFSKMRGTPRVGLVPPADKGGNVTVKLVGFASKGYDAIGTPAPAEDFVIEGDLVVTGAPGGIAFRAVNGRDAVRGGLLVVDPRGKTMLASSDDAGVETPLAAPIDTPQAPIHVKITVTGMKVEAVVGGTTLSGTLPNALKRGEIGLVARDGAHVNVAAFTAKKK